MCLLLEIDWDAYGVGWEGPVPTEDDASSLTIEELDDILETETSMKSSVDPYI